MNKINDPESSIVVKMDIISIVTTGIWVFLYTSDIFFFS